MARAQFQARISQILSTCRREMQRHERVVEASSLAPPSEPTAAGAATDSGGE